MIEMLVTFNGRVDQGFSTAALFASPIPIPATNACKFIQTISCTLSPEYSLLAAAKSATGIGTPSPSTLKRLVFFLRLRAHSVRWLRQDNRKVGR